MYVTYFNMPVDQPIELEIFIVISERIDQLFSNLQQAHIEEELEDGKDGDVEVDVQGNTTTWHPLISAITIDLLSSNNCENKEEIGG